jgi:tetratricopeptide (TPR) repeat protein
MYVSRLFIILFLGVLTFLNVKGSSTPDVLENRLLKATHDTLRIDILLKIGDHYEDSDYEKALEHYINALEISRNTTHSNPDKTHLDHLKELEIKSLRRIAFHQLSWEYYTESNEYYRNLLEIYKAKNDIENIVFALFSLGNIQYYQSHWNEAHSLYQEALIMAQNNNLAQRVADLRNNIANTFYYQGDYVKSMKEFQAASKIYDGLANYSGVGQTLLGIGNIYSETKNNDKALESYQTAVKYFDETNDHVKLAAAYTSLGAMYHENGNFKEAEKYYLLTIEKSRLVNNNYNLTHGLINMAMIYGARNQIADALNYLDQALEIAKRHSYKYIENVALRSKAVNHAKLANFTLAMEFAEKSLEIAREIESISDLAEGYKTLSEISQKTGDNAGALYYFQQYKAMSDSLLNIETQRQINEMQAIYQTEQQEQKIELQNLEIEKNREEIKRKNQIVATIIGLLILVVLLASLILFFNTKEKMKNQDIARQRQIIIKNMQNVKDLEEKVGSLNKKINKLETHNTSWKFKISEYQSFASNLLKTINGHDNILNTFFPGKCFIYPNTQNELPIDICYIRKLDDEILLVIADLQMNKLNKTMVNLAMSNFLNQFNLTIANINLSHLFQKLKEFFENLAEQQRLPSPVVKITITCINTKTKKIKTTSEHISVFIAISRNSESIFRPIYEYHELQKLAPIRNGNTGDKIDDFNIIKEFTLKATDRLYIINSGIIATTNQADGYDNPFEAGIVRLIDTHQNIEMELLGQYLRKEFRIITSRDKNLIPGIISVRGIEL